MKQKLFMSGLCLALALSLASCGGQQAVQEPQEPEQEVQQTEPISTPPAAEPTETKQEAEPTAQEAEPPAAPTESVAANEVEPVGEVRDDRANEPAEAVQLFEDMNKADKTDLSGLSVEQQAENLAKDLVPYAGGMTQGELEEVLKSEVTDEQKKSVNAMLEMIRSKAGDTSNIAADSNNQSNPSSDTSDSTVTSAFSDIDPDEAARKADFINNMQQFAEDHGLSYGVSDHNHTEEELQALANAIKVAP